MSNYTDLQEFFTSQDQLLQSRMKRVRLVLKELLRLLIEDCGFPANQVWFARRSSLGDPIEDAIDAIAYRGGDAYSILLLAEVGSEDGSAAYNAQVELWMRFGTENITFGTEDRVHMTLAPVPAGGPNSGMADLVELCRSAIRKQIKEYGHAGSLRDGIL